MSRVQKLVKAPVTEQFETQRQAANALLTKEGES